MSFDSISTTYKEWAASDENIQYQLVETLSFAHPAFDRTLYICDYSVNFTADLENSGGTVSFYPMPFGITYPNMKISTEQQITVDLDPLEGTLYAELKAMTPDDRLTPITIVHRTYLDGDTTGPVFLPVPTFRVQRITVDFNRVQVIATSTLIPRRRAGQTYTVEQFPPLLLT